MITKLPVVVIHAHSRCNCRCGMCDIWKNSEHQEFSIDQLEAQIPSLQKLGVEWVVFSGGEPLMHSHLFELCARLRELGIRVTLLTTGLLLGRFAELVAAHVDDLIVSLDGPREMHDQIRGVPGAFNLIRDGIAGVRGLNPSLRITARSTVQKANHAVLRETMAAAAELRMNGISFLAADLTSTAFHRDPPWPIARQNAIALTIAELAVLEKEIERVTAEPMVLDSPEHLARIVRHFRAHLEQQLPVAPRCNAPWVSAVIEVDGTVRPCFFHQPIGGLADSNLEAALNSVEARAFRGTLDITENPICRSCVCSLILKT